MFSACLALIGCRSLRDDVVGSYSFQSHSGLPYAPRTLVITPGGAYKLTVGTALPEIGRWSPDDSRGDRIVLNNGVYPVHRVFGAVKIVMNGDEGEEFVKAR